MVIEEVSAFGSVWPLSPAVNLFSLLCLGCCLSWAFMKSKWLRIILLCDRVLVLLKVFFLLWF